MYSFFGFLGVAGQVRVRYAMEVRGREELCLVFEGEEKNTGKHIFG